jgi:hypothetical protein
MSIGERVIGKNSEGSGCGLIKVIILLVRRPTGSAHSVVSYRHFQIKMLIYEILLKPVFCMFSVLDVTLRLDCLYTEHSAPNETPIRTTNALLIQCIIHYFLNSKLVQSYH